MHRSSYCGINCENCEVYIATMEESDALTLKVMEKWSKLYKRDFRKEEMICKGCKSDTVFVLCSKCDIKACNENRKIKNCEDCNDFTCDRIENFFEYQRTHDFGHLLD